jgi:hypothetical protein
MVIGASAEEGAGAVPGPDSSCAQSRPTGRSCVKARSRSARQLVRACKRRAVDGTVAAAVGPGRSACSHSPAFRCRCRAAACVWAIQRCLVNAVLSMLGAKEIGLAVRAVLW